MPQGKHNQACCDLCDALRRRGIHATVGHHKERSKGPTILTVYCQRAEDVAKVALGFGGYRVHVSTQAQLDKLLQAPADDGKTIGDVLRESEEL